jgi:hypothetical protein
MSAEAGAGALLVCNGRFELLDDRLGSRDWPDAGRLQVVTFQTPGTDGSFTALRGAGFQERVCTRFQLALRNAVVVDVDGAPRRLVPPLRFRSVAAALRVRAPSIESRTTDLARARGEEELESLRTA